MNRVYERTASLDDTCPPPSQDGFKVRAVTRHFSENFLEDALCPALSCQSRFQGSVSNGAERGGCGGRCATHQHVKPRAAKPL